MQISPFTAKMKIHIVILNVLRHLHHRRNLVIHKMLVYLCSYHHGITFNYDVALISQFYLLLHVVRRIIIIFISNQRFLCVFACHILHKYTFSRFFYDYLRYNAFLQPTFRLGNGTQIYAQFTLSTVPPMFKCVYVQLTTHIPLRWYRHTRCI